jgi:hypothetical protein
MEPRNREQELAGAGPPKKEEAEKEADKEKHATQKAELKGSGDAKR